MQTSQLLYSILKDIVILYVEDDSSTQEIISEILGEFCLDVKLASNGKEALDIYKKHMIDLLITDIEMPYMDGIALVEKIREDDISLSIIMLSAYSTNEYLFRSINLNVEAYIVKPVSYTKIKEALIPVAKKLTDKKSIYIKITQNLFYDKHNGCLIENEKEQDLQKKERALMELLVENRGNVIFYEYIEKVLWSDNDEVMTSSALRTVVKKLRAKVEQNFIVNVSGSGYKIV